MKENLDPDEILDALQTIVSDVDEFVSNWFLRVNECAKSWGPGKNPDAHLQKRCRELQSEKIRWEAQRKLEQQQIQEKAEQLTEAWLHLEEEQRKFLQLKRGQRQPGSERGPAVEGSALSENPRPIAARDSLPTALARESAVRQFQQLQREIEFSRP